MNSSDDRIEKVIEMDAEINAPEFAAACANTRLKNNEKRS